MLGLVQLLTNVRDAKPTSFSGSLEFLDYHGCVWLGNAQDLINQEH